jgi:hypothetical protein
MPQANRELARRYFEEVINERRFEVCADIIAADYTEHAVAPFSQSEPGHVDGPRTTRESLEWLVAQFPDITMKIEALLAEATPSSCGRLPRAPTSAS